MPKLINGLYYKLVPAKDNPEWNKRLSKDSDYMTRINSEPKPIEVICPFCGKNPCAAHEDLCLDCLRCF